MGVLLGLSSGSIVVVWMAGGPAIRMGDSWGPGRASRGLMALGDFWCARSHALLASHWPLSHYSNFTTSSV